MVVPFPEPLIEVSISANAEEHNRALGGSSGKV
jgi:hypothetical protein